MSMDTEFSGKVLDTVNNMSKLAANISAKTAAKTEEKKDENMNQPHNQTVEVKVGETGEVRKPMILKEKTETHIHKVFPDNRELNEKECELEKLRLNNEHELKMKELEFRMRQEEEARIERKEREEYARREREKRQQSDKKFFRFLGWGIVGAGVIGAGFAAYDYYTHSRCAANNRRALGEPGAVQLKPEEGKVE